MHAMECTLGYVLDVCCVVGGTVCPQGERAEAPMDLALRFLIGVSVSAKLILPLSYNVAPLWAIGLMFWLRRKRFVGSYSFFRATRRS